MKNRIVDINDAQLKKLLKEKIDIFIIEINENISVAEEIDVDKIKFERCFFRRDIGAKAFKWVSHRSQVVR